MKVITPPVINHFSWYGPVCSRPCFSVQHQEFEYSISYETRASKKNKMNKVPPAKMIRLKTEKETKSVCQSRLFSRKKFVFSSCHAPKIEDFITGWCGIWKFTVIHCPPSSSQKRSCSRYLLFSTWRWWYISRSGSESKCETQRQRKLGLFANMNFRSCKYCKRTWMLLLGLCTI